MGETIEMTAGRKKGGALDRNDIKAMMLYVAEQVVKQEPFLTEIDLKVGDGDHGTGMKRGFMEVLRTLPEYEPSSPEDVFRFVGTTLLDTMGGASGVLFGTVFISGLTGRKEHTFLELRDFADIFSQSLQALKREDGPRREIRRWWTPWSRRQTDFALQQNVETAFWKDSGRQRKALPEEWSTRRQ